MCKVADHENHVRWIYLTTVLCIGEGQKYARTGIITSLHNSLLLNKQSGIMMPAVVTDTKHNHLLTLPVMNETSTRFVVRKHQVMACVEMTIEQEVNELSSLTSAKTPNTTEIPFINVDHMEAVHHLPPSY